jgi:hypothetical protein
MKIIREGDFDFIKIARKTYCRATQLATYWLPPKMHSLAGCFAGSFSEQHPNKVFKRRIGPADCWLIEASLVGEFRDFIGDPQNMQRARTVRFGGQFNAAIRKMAVKPLSDEESDQLLLELESPPLAPVEPQPAVFLPLA